MAMPYSKDEKFQRILQALNIDIAEVHKLDETSANILELYCGTIDDLEAVPNRPTRKKLNVIGLPIQSLLDGEYEKFATSAVDALDGALDNARKAKKPTTGVEDKVSRVKQQIEDYKSAQNNSVQQNNKSGDISGPQTFTSTDGEAHKTWSESDNVEFDVDNGSKEGRLSNEETSSENIRARSVKKMPTLGSNTKETIIQETPNGTPTNDIKKTKRMSSRLRAGSTSKATPNERNTEGEGNQKDESTEIPDGEKEFKIFFKNKTHSKEVPSGNNTEGEKEQKDESMEPPPDSKEPRIEHTRAEEMLSEMNTKRKRKQEGEGKELRNPQKKSRTEQKSKQITAENISKRNRKQKDGRKVRTKIIRKRNSNEEASSENIIEGAKERGDESMEPPPASKDFAIESTIEHTISEEAFSEMITEDDGSQEDESMEPQPESMGSAIKSETEQTIIEEAFSEMNTEDEGNHEDENMKSPSVGKGSGADSRIEENTAEEAPSGNITKGKRKQKDESKELPPASKELRLNSRPSSKQTTNKNDIISPLKWALLLAKLDVATEYLAGGLYERYMLSIVLIFLEIYATRDLKTIQRKLSGPFQDLSMYAVDLAQEEGSFASETERNKHLSESLTSYTKFPTDRVTQGRHVAFWYSIYMNSHPEFAPDISEEFPNVNDEDFDIRMYYERNIVQWRESWRKKYIVQTKTEEVRDLLAEEKDWLHSLQRELLRLLVEQFQQSDKTVGTLKRQNENLNAKLGGLLEIYQDLDDVTSESVIRYDGEQRLFSADEDPKMNWDIKVKELMNKWKDEKKEKKKLKEQLELQKKETAELRKKLKDKEEEVDTLRKTTSEETAMLKELGKRLKDKEDDTTKLRNTLNDKEKEIDTLHESTSKETAMLKEQLELRGKETAELGKRLKDKEEDTAKLRNTLNDKEKEIDTLHKSMFKETAMLKEQLELRRKETAELGKRLKDKDNDLPPSDEVERLGTESSHENSSMDSIMTDRVGGKDKRTEQVNALKECIQRLLSENNSYHTQLKIVKNVLETFSREAVNHFTMLDQESKAAQGEGLENEVGFKTTLEQLREISSLLQDTAIINDIESLITTVIKKIPILKNICEENNKNKWKIQEILNDQFKENTRTQSVRTIIEKWVTWMSEQELNSEPPNEFLKLADSNISACIDELDAFIHQKVSSMTLNDKQDNYDILINSLNATASLIRKTLTSTTKTYYLSSIHKSSEYIVESLEKYNELLNSHENAILNRTPDEIWAGNINGQSQNISNDEVYHVFCSLVNTIKQKFKDQKTRERYQYAILGQWSDTNDNIKDNQQKEDLSQILEKAGWNCKHATREKWSLYERESWFSIDKVDLENMEQSMAYDRILDNIVSLRLHWLHWPKPGGLLPEDKNKTLPKKFKLQDSILNTGKAILEESAVDEKNNKGRGEDRGLENMSNQEDKSTQTSQHTHDAAVVSLTSMMKTIQQEVQENKGLYKALEIRISELCGSSSQLVMMTQKLEPIISALKQSSEYFIRWKDLLSEAKPAGTDIKESLETPGPKARQDFSFKLNFEGYVYDIASVYKERDSDYVWVRVDDSDESDKLIFKGAVGDGCSCEYYKSIPLKLLFSSSDEESAKMNAENLYRFYKLYNKLIKTKRVDIPKSVLFESLVDLIDPNNNIRSNKGYSFTVEMRNKKHEKVTASALKDYGKHVVREMERFKSARL